MRGVVWGVLCAAALGAGGVQAAGPSHCQAPEVSIWSCRAHGKVYEVCASADLSRTRGYLQYRAGPVGKPELVFPAQQTGTLSAFQYQLLPKGAELTFTHGDYQYALTESLTESGEIWVTRGQRTSRRAVQCQTVSNTLTLTTTLERFQALGLAR